MSVKVPEQWKLYYQAYLRLEGERVDHLSHIPWSAIARYCTFYHLNADQADWMVEIIERVDNAVIEKRQKDDKDGNVKNSRRQAKQASRPGRR